MRRDVSFVAGDIGGMMERWGGGGGEEEERGQGTGGGGGKISGIVCASAF